MFKKILIAFILVLPSLSQAVTLQCPTHLDWVNEDAWAWDPLVDGAWYKYQKPTLKKPFLDANWVTNEFDVDLSSLLPTTPLSVEFAVDDDDSEDETKGFGTMICHYDFGSIRILTASNTGNITKLSKDFSDDGEQYSCKTTADHPEKCTWEQE